MNDTELQLLFQSWWRQSYPHSPPGQHALATHVGWGQYLLQHVQRQQQIDRATLAQPEPVGPTDAELMGLDDLEAAWNAQADAFNSWDELGMDEIIWFAQQQILQHVQRQQQQQQEVGE